jgi:RNA polymerase sigma-70 factor (ECF subfamily)
MDERNRLHDEWLALRCQSGDADGFTDLVDRFQSPLLYYAAKISGNLETGRDIVQEAWIRVARDLRKLEKPESLRPWLYRIVHGLAVDRVRSDLARERAEDISGEAFEEAIELTVSVDSAEAVHRALDFLAPKHREVLTLFFLESFSVAEISDVTGCTQGTVKSRLHYAKAALRQALQSQP